MTNKEDIIKAFLLQYPDLANSKAEISIEEILEEHSSETGKSKIYDPPKKQINVTHLFVFDVRLIPEKFNDCEVKSYMKGGFPPEFPSTEDSLPLNLWFAPERYIAFVNNNIKLIRNELNNPTLTKDEALDALTGGFEKHIKWCNSKQIKVITAKDFIKDWIAFDEKYIKSNNWLKEWDSSNTWSNFILGTKTSSSTISPIGNYFVIKYKANNLRYRTEDGLYDLSFTLNKNITSIPTLGKNYDIEYFDNNEEVFYPSVYDILLEHENDIYDSWQEVAKLAYVRAYLKVLVTYNSDNLTEDRISKENEMMIKTFERIIPQCNNNFPDNEQTEYLLIIGNKTTTNTLDWKYYVFDSNGKAV